MLWSSRTAGVSLVDSVHLLADASETADIAGSWSPGASGINSASLDWALHVASLICNLLVNLLNLVLLERKTGQILPELVSVHFVELLSMSGDGG